MAIQRRTLIAIAVAVLLSLLFVPVAAGDGAADTNPLSPDTVTAVDDDANTTETVVVRFSDDMETADVSSAAELQTNAQHSQEPFADAAEVSPYVDIQESFWIANAMLVEYDDDVLSEDDLTNVSGVEYVHPNFEVSVNSGSTSTAATTSNTSFMQSTEVDTTYGLDMVRAPETWDTYDTQGEGVGVAVLDTGVDTDHEAIDIEGWAEFDEDGDPVDSDPHDYDGHGTHVAGTVAGDAVNGKEIGVAPEADLYGVKVLDNGGTFTQAIAGMEWATEKDDDIDILQMSLGAPGYFDEMIEPVENAREAGQIVSASIGNSGENTSGSPGNVYSSLSAGAVDANQDVPNFSSGEIIDTADAWDDPPDEWPDEYVVPDVTAPGVNVESANSGTVDGTETLSGTSMASPHVAGSAALVLSILDEDDEAAAQTEELLRETANHPAGSTTPDTRHGAGIVDSFAAATEAFDGAMVVGEVTDETDDPIQDITVESSEGTTATTDGSGEYQLAVPHGQQDITASGFGWSSDSASINAGDETITKNFELTETTDVAIDSAAPSRVNPNKTYNISFDIANVNTYSVSVDGTDSDGSNIDPELFTIEHNGAVINQDSEVSVPDGVSFEVSVTTEAETFGTATLNHAFEGEYDTVSIGSGVTHIHPESVHIPQDVHPDQLQSVIDVLYGGTTLSLDSDTNFDETVTEDQPTAVHINRPLTLTGDGGTATIDISGTADTETTGIDISGVGAHVESVAVTGDVDTGIAMSESDVTATDISADGPETGTVATSGDFLTDATYDNVDTGVVVDTGFEELTDITATASDTGVVIEGAATDIENLDLSLDGTGNGIIIDDGSVDTITDIDVSNGETGLEAVAVSDLTVDDAIFDELDTGVVLTDSSDITISDTSITASETATELADGTTTTTVEDSQLAAGELTFGDVPIDSNTIDAEYIDRAITLSATNTTVMDTDEPAQLDTHGSVGAFYDLTAHTNDATTDLTVEYDSPDETIQVSERSLQFYRFDGADWTTISDSTADTEQQTVSTTLDDYSTIGVYGEGVPYMTIEEQVAVNEIQPGDRIDVFTTIENQGLASGTDTVEYEFDSDLVDSETITLDPDASETIPLGYETPSDIDEGEYEYTITTANDTLSDTVTIDNDAASPNITANLSFDTQINIEDTLSVTVELENIGEGDGTSERILTVGDETLVDDVIHLNASELSSETFDISLDDPGEYEVMFNDESFGTVNVTDPEEEEDDGIPGFGVVTALIALFTALALSRIAGSESDSD